MDTAFFILSKLVAPLLRVDGWLAIAALAAFVALALGRRRLALWLSGGVAAGFLAVAVLPVAPLMLRPLEAAHPMAPPLVAVDGIILLGGGEDVAATLAWGGIQLNAGAERLIAAAALARRFPQARLLLAGAGGRLRDLGGVPQSEAAIMAAFLHDQGIDPARLIREDRSRNTAENARLGLLRAAPQPGETWVLVTSAFHMPRALRSFAAAGWPDLVPWPVDHRSARLRDGLGFDPAGNMALINIAIREAVGRVVYGLTGR